MSAVGLERRMQRPEFAVAWSTALQVKICDGTVLYCSYSKRGDSRVFRIRCIKIDMMGRTLWFAAGNRFCHLEPAAKLAAAALSTEGVVRVRPVVVAFLPSGWNAHRSCCRPYLDA